LAPAIQVKGEKRMSTFTRFLKPETFSLVIIVLIISGYPGDKLLIAFRNSPF